jgi:hypothetical protein
MRLRDLISEMPLASYDTLGDFDKSGPFRHEVDRKLITHDTNKLKTAQFLENTPYDFRLFFSNVTGTGKKAETGLVKQDTLAQMFSPEQVNQIMQGHESAITIVFVGNSGTGRVMMTPWIMAHRFGHAIQATNRRMGNVTNAWTETEKLFFNTVNGILQEYYGKNTRSSYNSSVNWDMSAEYNALFNAIGTQRSSRTGQIKRPYEFLYELFAQYIKTGHVTLNPLPVALSYGRKAWGNATNGMRIKQDYADELSREEATARLANDMGMMFSDVLGNAEGNVYVM